PSPSTARRRHWTRGPTRARSRRTPAPNRARSRRRTVRRPPATTERRACAAPGGGGRSALGDRGVVRALGAAQPEGRREQRRVVGLVEGIEGLAGPLAASDTAARAEARLGGRGVLALRKAIP